MIMFPLCGLFSEEINGGVGGIREWKQFFPLSEVSASFIQDKACQNWYGLTYTQGYIVCINSGVLYLEWGINICIQINGPTHPDWLANSCIRRWIDCKHETGIKWVLKLACKCGSTEPSQLTHIGNGWLVLIEPHLLQYLPQQWDTVHVNAGTLFQHGPE